MHVIGFAMKGKSSLLLLVGSVLLLVIFQSAKISSIVILDKPAYPTDDNCFSLFNRSLGRRVARPVLLVSAMEVEPQHLFSSLHKKY